MAKMLRTLGLVLTLLLVLGALVSPAPAAAGSPVSYTVTWGDTLYSIASRYGMSVYTLMQANGLRNANYIYIGQRLFIPSSGAPLPPVGTSTYVVRPGDTLFSIASRYGTTVDALRQANGLYSFAIYVGQVLRIAGYPPAPRAPIYPPAVPIPPTGGTYYIVQPGDYLGLIAARFGVSVYAIQMANRLYNSSFIFVGQRLFIPGAVKPYVPQPYNRPYNPPPIYPPYYPPPYVPIPPAAQWVGALVSNTVNQGPCSIAVTVQGKENWPVVLTSLDNGTTTDPKYTGTKPERGPYVVEFAPSCTGTWRVIPLGLNASVDVTLYGGHAEVEFHQNFYPNYY